MLCRDEKNNRYKKKGLIRPLLNGVTSVLNDPEWGLVIHCRIMQFGRKYQANKKDNVDLILKA
jgi:hypothetical protein